MPTKSIGKGKKNLSITLTDKEKDKIDALALRSQMSRSEYCRKILRKYLEAGTYFGDQPELTSKKAR